MHSLSTSASARVNDLFDDFAVALERMDTKAMAMHYNMPCMLLANDSETAFSDYGRLEGFFNRGAYAYRQFGIAKVRHEVRMKQEWAGQIFFARLRWHYLDADDRLVYHCDYNYILKPDKNGAVKIAMSVSLNEREQMQAWKDSLAPDRRPSIM